MMRYWIITFFLLVFFTKLSFAQSLIAQAGNNKNICPETTHLLGGNPTANGGTPPYTYLWEPSTFLNNTGISNPTATNISSSIEYTLTVTDSQGNTAKDRIIFYLDLINTFNAGIDTGYCFGQESGIVIGAPNNNGANHQFSWLPSDGLNNSSLPNPIATPTANTNYTLTVSNNGFCDDYITQVNVFAFMPPYVDAGPDTLIDEGNTITLNGIGGTKFWWQPDYRIRYGSTHNPDVWPIISTTYTLHTEDSHGCYNWDTVRVNVRKGDILFFYNTFTPNGDGENDIFYIGNLEKYPDNSLKIYNRYGKLIFSATNYENNWDGKYLGEDIPTGTYAYIFDDGKGNKYKGTVTILR